MTVWANTAALFLIYSFLGWCLEAVLGSFRQKSFVNKGVLNGPVCPIYGFTAVFILVISRELRDNWFFLFLGSAVISSAVELTTGKILEQIYGRKWWDYSGKRWNYEGYICLEYSVIWGILGVLIVEFITPFFLKLLGFIPLTPRLILTAGLGGILLLDAAETLLLAFRFRNRERAEVLGGRLKRLTLRLGNWIFQRTQKRLMKAYPNNKKVETASVMGKGEPVFAKGCNFYKLVWLFLIGAFLGDIVETIFCCVTSGVWMSRSSVVYGPFSVVWGLGCVLLTALLYRFKDREDRYLFLAGMLLGGAYEYICSVFTEIVFGTVFWDYSHIPFNLGGRINLLYCFFWGIAALVWMKFCYPFLSRLIEKIPLRPGKILTWILLVLMVFNMLISAAALSRYSARAEGKAPANQVEEFLDQEFPDSRMEKIYPNAVIR